MEQKGVAVLRLILVIFSIILVVKMGNQVNVEHKYVELVRTSYGFYGYVAGDDGMNGCSAHSVVSLATNIENNWSGYVYGPRPSVPCMTWVGNKWTRADLSCDSRRLGCVTRRMSREEWYTLRCSVHPQRQIYTNINECVELSLVHMT